MKRLASIICLIAFITFNSCDKVNAPIVKKSTVKGSNFIVQTSDPAAVDPTAIRKVLIEDYTGLRCVNCPEGADIVKALLENYGSKLIAISVHQGSLAGPLKSYPKDFRTAAGDAWGAAGGGGFGMSSWPTGLVNRKKYSSSTELLDRGVWPSAVSQAMKDPFIVKLILTTKYDTTARALYAYVDATFKKNYPNKVNVIVAYLEDEGLIGPQDQQIGPRIEEYEFKHVLRGTLNGNWGTGLGSSLPLGNTLYKDSFNTVLPDTINPFKNKYGTWLNHNHVSVVAFIYDATTREVLQVEKVKITGE